MYIINGIAYAGELYPRSKILAVSCLSFRRPASLPKLAWHKAMLRFVALHGSKNPVQ